jgi:hypothetical protein
MYIIGFSLFVGSIAFVIGLFLLFAPGILKRVNELSARMIARVDTLAFSYRIGLGVSLILVSLFMFFMAYYYAKRYH